MVIGEEYQATFPTATVLTNYIFLFVSQLRGSGASGIIWFGVGIRVVVGMEGVGRIVFGGFVFKAGLICDDVSESVMCNLSFSVT